MASVEQGPAVTACQECGHEPVLAGRADRVYCSSAGQRGYRQRVGEATIEREGLAAMARLSAMCDAAGIPSRNADPVDSRNATGVDHGQR